MIGFHGHGTEAATIPTDATVSTAVFIQGKNKVAFEIPNIASGVVTATANVYAQVSNTSTTGTFKRLVTMGVYSANSGLQEWEVPSTTGNVNVVVPVVGYNYVRIELSNTATANVTCNVHVME